IIRMSPSGEITGSNPASERLLGLSADRMRLDVLHYHTLGIIDEDGAEIPRDSFPPLVALRTGREVRNIVIGLCNPYDGRRRWLLVNAVPQYREGESEPCQVLSTLEDITEFKNMKSRISLVNERLETIFQSAPLAIFDLDGAGRVNSLWNAAAERMFGWKKDEVLGKPLPIVPVESMAEFSSLRERVLCGESLSGIGLTRVRKDGSPIEISLAAAPLHDQHGAVAGIMAIASDMTDHNALERQYLHAQKMEAVGRLAGGVAHDFNNILTVILGNVSILMLDSDKGGEYQEILKEIHENAYRASGLTRQLLAFSRRQIIEPRVIILNSVLANMEKMLGRIIGEDIELATLPADDLWPVLIDPGQIEQVITNLSINARDAMPAGGRLTIETGNVTIEKEHILRHIAMKPGDYVMIAVSDTGCGMNRETQEKIFEPFFTTKETGKGTGLGLATCYGIVKQNGGFIWVYSEPGTGTVFKIYLPRVASPFIEEEAGDEITQDLHGAETLLLVEDEPAVRATLARILRKYGYTIIEASNGDEAKKITDEFGLQTIDLVVTDIVMPRMGGKEFMAELRKLATDIHVLFISGYTDMSVVKHIAMENNTAFLQKPFSPLTLARKIRDILDGGSGVSDG
ncbi:MAG: PAS domain S-box protein, partial [Candidatus Latescibacteria bacterium]|nr:PAS domain S-box protein [Candidatus Latescibacterota bacterium]